MGSVDDLTVTLGCGRNKTYDLLQGGQIPGAFQLNKRWLIPRAILTKIANGEIIFSNDAHGEITFSYSANAVSDLPEAESYADLGSPRRSTPPARATPSRGERRREAREPEIQES
jgi:hypothetical protein